MAKAHNTYQRQLERAFDRCWKKHLKSKGDLLLTLKPQKFPGLSIVIVRSSTIRIGNRNIKKLTQRTFHHGKPTKVPAVVADGFLEDESIIEWQDSMKTDVDSILDAEVIS